MSENISVKITLDDKFSSGMKNMTDQVKKISSEIKSLSTDLEKLSKKKINIDIKSKINIDINSNKLGKEIKDITKEAKGINDAINNLYKRDPKKRLDIHQEIMEIRKQSKHLLNDLKNLESERINIDINMHTSGMSDTDTNSGFSKKSIMSLIGNQIKDPAMDIASLYLPESISNGLNGAIEGAMAGASVAGAPGAVIGASVSAISNLVSTKIQQNVEKQQQRIQFGSSLIQQYLPQLAMGSINYGSRMEQTKLKFDKKPGINDSQKMIYDLQKISLKSSLDFFEIAEKAQEMLSQGFDQNNIINSLKAMEQEATTFDGLISNIKEGASQLILGPLGSGFIEGIKPALESFMGLFESGSEGFDNLKTQIREFGSEVGSTLGDIIKDIKITFENLFNDEEFNNKDLSGKITIIMDKLKTGADAWFEEKGEGIIDSIKNFFINLFVKLGEDSEFTNAIQELFVTISPNADTLKKISFKLLGIERPDTDSPTHPINKYRGRASQRSRAFGLDRVPYDGYRAVLHEGERVLTRVQADNQTGSISINKIADTVIVREESDIDKITQNLIAKLESYRLAYGGVM